MKWCSTHGYACGGDHCHCGSRSARTGIGAGPHVLPFGYQSTTTWPGPAPVLSIIPGFSDYDLGYDYGRAHCSSGAALMMRPTNPSDDWITGYDDGCASVREERHHRHDGHVSGSAGEHPWGSSEWWSKMVTYGGVGALLGLAANALIPGKGYPGLFAVSWGIAGIIKGLG